MTLPEQHPRRKEALDLIGAARHKKAPQPAGNASAQQPEPPQPAPAPRKAARSQRPEVLDLLTPKKKQAPKPADPKENSAVPAVPAPLPKIEAPLPVDPVSRTLNVKGPVSVAELAGLMGLKPFKLIADLLPMGVYASPATSIDTEQIAALCEKHGFIYERVKREKGAGVKAPVADVVEPPPVLVEDLPEEKLRLRTPIVTVMGHVDHGKTSLLDYIRRAHVVSAEAGGITQHIGAYTVEYEGKSITFIDTPGHAIFTEMRARGADVTDIVVLVVAANDGIMPQTQEAITHAKAAGKTIIVAVNKCDLPSADPMRVRTQLMEEGLVPTDFGGDVECVNISAATGEGIPEFLELLNLQAEVLELKADPKGNCRATIIEARVEQGRGSSATVIVQTGTLKVGMPFICGPFAGKVRTMFDDRGRAIKRVLPGMPAEVVGFMETPNVGDELVEMESERAAKKLSGERLEELRVSRLAQPRRARMEDILMGLGDQKAQLKLYLKGDVQGSVEAIKRAILNIESDKVECVFIGAAVGPIAESDVLLASSSDAVILGFNVKVESNAVKMLKREGIQVKIYSIVYELIDQVRDAMLGLLEPETRETLLGHAEVKQVFKLNKGKAAGCAVTDGKMHRSSEARVLRDGQVVFDGRMSTLRRFQDEVEEVKAGLECGIRLADYNDYEEGDVIECYTLEKVRQTL